MAPDERMTAVAAGVATEVPENVPNDVADDMADDMATDIATNMAKDGQRLLAIEVVFAASPGHIDTVALQLPGGATLLHALQASGLLQRHALAAVDLRVGVWSRQQPLDFVLRDRDRVEIYRPLTVDPKEARRLRYKQHRERIQGGRPSGNQR